MTAAYRIEINDGAVTKLFNRLDHSAVMRTLRPPMEASLLSLHDDLTDYPGPPQRPYPKMLRTAKQRRWFFWALKEGKISIPYARSGKLGQSWNTHIDETGSGMYGKIGTNMSYAKWVQNAESQARIHQGNWLTDEQAFGKRRDEIVLRFRHAIRAALAAGPSGG